MQSILHITLVVFAMMALSESLRIWPPKPVNPCRRSNCPKGTKCIVKNRRPFCQPVFCSLPAETGLCKAYFVRYFYNTASKRCDDFVYGGCGGNKNNFVDKVDCKRQCDDPGPPCPYNKPLHYCVIPPCQNAKCSLYPGAKCVNNYCGGCNADFYLGDVKVNCDCPPPLTIHQCKKAPCDGKVCFNNPIAKCINNYCGGCFADFYYRGHKVKCGDPLPPPNPCRFSICQPGQKCVVENGKGKCVFQL
ncbi:uncharacterized protein ZC84.1-like [Dendronephthya gigantea]|uniref:uncharacterized protein ZC84.1-like n=1 Tax=Dendronephthya gigantea TaxID=151771 RepID=UPI00106C716E|nr:uncharacterized protein ZC84.1-like [Dendronephthya gigantea]